MQYLTMKEEGLEQELRHGANDARSKRAELSASQTTATTAASIAVPTFPAPTSTRVTSNSTKTRSFKRFRFWGLSRASKDALLSSGDGRYGKECSNGSDADDGFWYNKNVFEEDDYCYEDSDCPLKRSLEKTGFI